MPSQNSTTTAADRPESSDRLADETIPCSVWIRRPDGAAPCLPDPHLNRSWTAPGECRGPGWSPLPHPEDAETLLAGWKRCSAAGEPWRFCYRIRGIDGECRTVASRGIPVRDAAGRVVLWAGVNLDITGRDEPVEEARELAALSAIARAIEENPADPGEAFREAVRLVPRGFRDPERVSARVVSRADPPGPGRIVAGIPAGHLVVECREGREDPFLPQERDFVRAVAGMLGAAVRHPVSGEEYRLLFDRMPDAGLILEILRDGPGNPVGFRVARINRRGEEILRCRHQEAAGEDLVTVIPSLTPAEIDLFYRVARTGMPVHHKFSSPVTGACYELKVYRPQHDLLTVIAEDVTDRRRAEEMLRDQRIALDQRLRELGTLYAVSGIVERPGISIEEILGEVAAILPAGWLHPEDVAARITLDGREYRSTGFVETPWRLESPIAVRGRIAGKVEVCYRHRPPGDSAAFLTDARRLIAAVAGRLGWIVARVRATEALGRSEEKYRLLFERMLESYTLYEVVRDDAGNPVDYRIIELNENAADVFGRSREELIGQRLFDIFPAIRDGARALYGEVAETGVPVQRRLQEPRSGRWYDLQIYRPQAGRLTVTGQEITRQKRAELALRESEERFRGIFEQAGTGIAVIDPDGRIAEANPAFVRMFGYDEEELYAMRLRDLIYPPDRGEGSLLSRKKSSGGSTRRELRFVTKDGRTIWGRLTTSLLRDSGEGEHLITMVEDVTERRKMQDALAKREERFREIAQQSFDMIYTCYADRGITYISPAVTRILGYTPEEMIGRRWSDYVLDASRPEWEEAGARIVRGEPVEGLVVELRRKDGTAAAVEMNESAIVEHGRVVGVHAIGRDISDRKCYEDMRLQAFYQIEQNIEQFAILADHIRLPLQVILGMADLLDDAKKSEKIREQVKRINAIVKQLDEGWVESRSIREFLRRNELV